MQALFIGLIIFGILDGVYHLKVRRPKQLRAEAIARKFEAVQAAIQAIAPGFAQANGYELSTSQSTWMKSRMVQVEFTRGGETLTYRVFVRSNDGKVEPTIDRTPAGPERVPFLSALARGVSAQLQATA